MRIASAILLLIASSGLFVWAFNISFGSHIVEERKKFWVFYLTTHLLTILAVGSAAIGILLLK
jgi:hypothetical protein